MNYIIDKSEIRTVLEYVSKTVQLYYINHSEMMLKSCLIFLVAAASLKYVSCGGCEVVPPLNDNSPSIGDLLFCPTEI